jgi:hypothetical protein
VVGITALLDIGATVAVSSDEKRSIATTGTKGQRDDNAPSAANKETIIDETLTLTPNSTQDHVLDGSEDFPMPNDDEQQETLEARDQEVESVVAVVEEGMNILAEDRRGVGFQQAHDQDGQEEQENNDDDGFPLDVDGDETLDNELPEWGSALNETPTTSMTINTSSPCAKSTNDLSAARSGTSARSENDRSTGRSEKIGSTASADEASIRTGVGTEETTRANDEPVADEEDDNVLEADELCEFGDAVHDQSVNNDGGESGRGRPPSPSGSIGSNSTLSTVEGDRAHMLRKIGAKPAAAAPMHPMAGVTDSMALMTTGGVDNLLLAVSSRLSPNFCPVHDDDNGTVDDDGSLNSDQSSIAGSFSTRGRSLTSHSRASRMSQFSARCTDPNIRLDILQNLESLEICKSTAKKTKLKERHRKNKQKSSIPRTIFAAMYT